MMLSIQNKVIVTTDEDALDIQCDARFVDRWLDTGYTGECNEYLGTLALEKVFFIKDFDKLSKAEQAYTISYI